jgi:hypothetical protein
VAGVRPEEFYDHFSRALIEGNAAIFAGAGLSRPAGFVDWKGLMEEIARDLDLDVAKESDLIALAQYHLNNRASRAKLNRKLIEEFTEDVSITENHRLIANLPIRTIWTTNYDTLIEQAFAEAKKRYDAKITPQNLPVQKPRSDVTIFKMHGDISQPDAAVLTKEDYELYHEHRQGFSIQLQSDLISKTFLFLGFSFTDPNIDYILSRIRVLLGQNTGEHYCVMRDIPRPSPFRGKAKADYEYDVRKQELKIADLKRYGINALMVREYSEVTDHLRELNRRVHLNDVFVSGSAHSYEPRGRDSVEDLARLLGREIVRRGFNLISGFGLGVGGSVIVGALETAYEDDRASLEERLILRPFPQSGAPAGMSREAFWTRYRRSMISKAGFAVFLTGNKLDPTSGEVVTAGGVLEEFAIASELGVHPIPVGATGSAARQIWETVTGDLDRYYPDGGVKGHFQTLGSEGKSNQELIEAIFAIIRRVKRH